MSDLKGRMSSFIKEARNDSEPFGDVGRAQDKGIRVYDFAELTGDLYKAVEVISQLSRLVTFDSGQAGWAGDPVEKHIIKSKGDLIVQLVDKVDADLKKMTKDLLKVQPVTESDNVVSEAKVSDTASMNKEINNLLALHHGVMNVYMKGMAQRSHVRPYDTWKQYRDALRGLRKTVKTAKSAAKSIQRFTSKIG